MKTLSTKNNLYALIAVFVLAGIGVTVGSVASAPRSDFACDTANYQHINPSRVCGSPYVITKGVYTVFEKRLKDFIDEAKFQGRVKSVSVSFRDLRNGPLFGSGVEENFSSASLAKLPVAMAFFVLEEEQPGTLTQKLIFNGDPPGVSQTFKSPKSLEKGRAYTIEDLLFQSLAYSDNSAYELLRQYMVSDADRLSLLTRTFQELGLIGPYDNPLAETVTVRSYTSVFTILYHASYLSVQDSEKILTWLSQATFNRGLRRGVPAMVKVAHKFGERITQDNAMQLHDCGIVYYPENPYLLCVMTKGESIDTLATVISRISNMVYKEVDSRRIK